MKHTYVEKADNLRDSIMQKLGRSWVGKGEDFRDTGLRGYDLDGAKNNFEYDAIVFVNGRWELVNQDENLCSINVVGLDTLCEYADYIIKKYKL